MRVRAQDSAGDYTFGQGRQNFLVNSAAMVAQLIRTALLLFLGEFFLDTTAGVAWLTEVIGINTGPNYDTVIRNAIQNVQGVSAILEYSSSLVGRNLTVNVTVSTIFGSNATANGISVQLPEGWGTGGFGTTGFGA